MTLQRSIVIVAIAAAATTTVLAVRLTPEGSQSRTVFSGMLPALDGGHLQSTIVEVIYPPGGANPAHRHPCLVIGYVLDGAIRTQIAGQPERIFKSGDTFFEVPSDVHVVSANASRDNPARFLAYFVCDRSTPLSVPVPDRGARR